MSKIPDMFDAAERFSKAIPPDCPPSSTYIEEDGMIEFEWYISGFGCLSVSVDRDSVLYWAALIGSERHHATDLFGPDNKIPDALLGLIRRFGSEKKEA